MDEPADGATSPHAPRRAPKPHASKDEKVVVAASGFTSLWALTWMGAEAMAVNSALQGGFAVGSVMAGSGLAILWWKTKTLRDLHDESEKAEAAAAAKADTIEG
jgi:hypothetical protein